MMNTVSLPVKRQNLADEVAERLLQQLRSRKYVIGQKLPTEPELMQEFGVGRSTIREAVRILVNAGLVKVQQGLGTFVLAQEVTAEPLSKRLQRAHFRDLDEVRLLLETKIAEKAALRRTPKDIANMKKFLQQRKRYAKANNQEACIEADVNFHSSIAEASRNEIIVDLYRTIAVHLKQSFGYRHSDTAAFRDSQHLHEALLQSIIDKAPEQAVGIVAQISAHGRK